MIVARNTSCGLWLAGEEGKRIMKNLMKNVSITAMVAAAMIVAGCESNSHYSKHEYSYDGDTGNADTNSNANSRYRSNQPPPPSQGQRGQQDQLNEEYQMVSPGQMVVDPK